MGPTKMTELGYLTCPILIALNITSNSIMIFLIFNPRLKTNKPNNSKKTKNRNEKGPHPCCGCYGCSGLMFGAGPTQMGPQSQLRFQLLSSVGRPG